MDDALNAKWSGLGVLIKSPSGDLIEHSLYFAFKATNNEAEALTARLKLACKFGARSINKFSDFQLVVQYINGEYEVKASAMVLHLEKVKEFDENLPAPAQPITR